MFSVCEDSSSSESRPSKSPLEPRERNFFQSFSAAFAVGPPAYHVQHLAKDELSSSGTRADLAASAHACVFLLELSLAGRSWLVGGLQQPQARAPLLVRLPCSFQTVAEAPVALVQ